MPAPRSPLAPCLDRWLATPAARAWPGPESAAMAWTALALRTGAILMGCKTEQLRHTATAAEARAFAVRPALPAWRRLLRLDEPHAEVHKLAHALEDTAFASTLLKSGSAASWLELARALPAQAALPALETLYLMALGGHATAARRDFGQFYTPAPLVEAMWQLGWAQWRALGATPALLLDPCCGSGAFFRHPASVPPEAQESAALPRLGFELQRLPRTLARLHAWAAGRPHERVLDVDALTHRVTAAGPRFVIGNPPWRNPSPALRSPEMARFLHDELMPYAWRYEGVALASLRGCTHGVREDSVFFLGRVLDWLAPGGVATLVTSDSWLDAPSYTLVRRYLLDTARVHTVLRLGRCFPGVRERAAVVVLSRGYAPAGRQQAIAHADWSAHAAHWTEARFATPRTPETAQGATAAAGARRAAAGAAGGLPGARMPATAPMQVDPHLCQLRPPAARARRAPSGAPGPGRVPLHALFVRSVAGAQSGCAPLFLHAHPETLERRMERLFAGALRDLAEEIGPQVRGGAAQALGLLQRVAAAQQAHGARPRALALRPIWAHFRGAGGAPPRKQGWCYFDPRLWLFPRVPRQAGPGCFWDMEPKLAFRDVYDPHDKPIAGIVDTAGWVCDNHVFNGGTRVAAVCDPDGARLLTPVGERVRQRFPSDVAFLTALARCLNGPAAQRWGHDHPRQPLTVELARLRHEA